MPRRIIFDPEARLEFDNAVAWYNAHQPGSGDRFELEVQGTLQRVLANPEGFRLVGRTTRVVRLKTFHKYSICFHVEPEFIGVVSIFHGSRDPDDLRRRLK